MRKTPAFEKPVFRSYAEHAAAINARQNKAQARDCLLIGVACGAAMLLAGFGIGLAVRPLSAPAPRYELQVTDHEGNLYVAGAGDDCAAAFKGAKFPADWRELICIQAN